MEDLDFQRIAPRCRGQPEAFEELCCQLACRTLAAGVHFVRLHGAGGDGGVECFSDQPDGTRVGWQAKYVFNVDSLIRQLDLSLSTALTIHETLERYIVCFPFNLTGPTGRRGRSGQEKFEKWRKKRESDASAEGRNLAIEQWSAQKLRSLILDLDTSGGLSFYFFNEAFLTREWFSAHLESVKANAGPRYTPELNVETDLYKWFAAFGGTSHFLHNLNNELRSCQKSHKDFCSAVKRRESDSSSPAWPKDLREHAQSLMVRIEAVLDSSNTLTKANDSQAYSRCSEQLGKILQDLEFLESEIIDDLEAKHPEWKGRVDSAGFRQFWAEYMVSFPAANLYLVQDISKAFTSLRDLLRSHEGLLAFKRAFLLAGETGVGKTHGVCDIARTRFQDKLLTCVVFGHQFGGEPDPWTRLLETVGLPTTLGRSGLLDALNSAAEASGSFLILCIDALNETRPLRYWRNRLTDIVRAVNQRPYVRLCVTCKTPYLSHCIPDGLKIPVIEYQGFAGIERYACREFFQYYKLKPPITPILQPELKNPLYLRLLCETLRARGLDRLPTGWYGIAPVIKAFIEEKEQQFADEYETSTSANMIGGGLRAICRAIVDSGNSTLPRSSAEEAISATQPQATNLPVLDWLLRNGLLVEDAPDDKSPFDNGGTVRPAFERLGDFLIAEELLSRIKPKQLEQALRPGGVLHSLVKDSETIESNDGLLSALSILLPESGLGLELPDLAQNDDVRVALLKITIGSLPWRNPATFSAASASLVLEGLRTKGQSHKSADAVLSVAWQPSSIDALWFDTVLRSHPLTKRDSWWCKYLHVRYQSDGVVKRLIDAAFELPLDDVEAAVAERWAIILLWFAAAADRRVKDWATRAVIALFVANPAIIPKVLTRFLDCDDDEVRERTLLSCYGALIVSCDLQVVPKISSILCQAFRDNPSGFHNALIRDHIRCIAELADRLHVLGEGCDPEIPMKPIGNDWPLALPSEKGVEEWERLPKLAHSCLHNDFAVYSINCLRGWEHGMSRKDMGKWILQRVAHDFGYKGAGCERYDAYMLSEYGPGRGKPNWAERIGKKYQWIAMYQLASRLYDHVEPQSDSLEPKPLRTPLILLEERKMDPTLPPRVVGGNRDADVWWIGSGVSFLSGEDLSDAEWVKRDEDPLDLKSLLATRESEGQRWQLLVSYPAWDNRKEEADWNDPYRHAWVHLESYLVPREHLMKVHDALHRRNFFGKWMPQGATWLYGFLGEYPWATSFNTESEEWHGRSESGQEVVSTCQPTWDRVVVEWEYDASLSGNFNVLVPARVFFTEEDLWWNGRDGYRHVNGRTIFRDPSIMERGPRSLIVDVDDFLERLKKMGMALIWVLLGEKWILGGAPGKSTPRRTFSQIAWLDGDGSVKLGDRVFFDDYDQKTGPSI